MNSVERLSSDRAHCSAQFSADRQVAMSEDKIKVQSARADYESARAERLKQPATEVI